MSTGTPNPGGGWDRRYGMTASDAIDEVLAALARDDPEWALRMVAAAVDAWRRVNTQGTPSQAAAWLTEPARLHELPTPWAVLVRAVVATWARRWGHEPPTWTATEPLPEPWSPLGHQPGSRRWARAEERGEPGLAAYGILLERSWFEGA